jgi:pimeloyl-ACP methyl ester carboxylesterase
MRDVLFGREVLDVWRKALPQARGVELDEAGHFLQEDAPEAFAAALVSLVSSRSASETDTAPPSPR